MGSAAGRDTFKRDCGDPCQDKLVPFECNERRRHNPQLGPTRPRHIADTLPRPTLAFQKMAGINTHQHQNPMQHPDRGPCDVTIAAPQPPTAETEPACGARAYSPAARACNEPIWIKI